VLGQSEKWCGICSLEDRPGFEKYPWNWPWLQNSALVQLRKQKIDSLRTPATMCIMEKSNFLGSMAELSWFMYPVQLHAGHVFVMIWKTARETRLSCSSFASGLTSQVWMFNIRKIDKSPPWKGRNATDRSTQTDPICVLFLRAIKTYLAGDTETLTQIPGIARAQFEIKIKPLRQALFSGKF
jgi:hypothetical protein